MGMQAITGNNGKELAKDTARHIPAITKSTEVQPSGQPKPASKTRLYP
jgi:hypothetical protein